MRTVNVIFKECFEIFSKHMLDEMGEPVACNLHEAFGNISETSHNCLGCNFADSINLILRYLRRNNELDDIQHDVSTYIFLLYLFVERIDMVFRIIKLPDIDKENDYFVFRQIRRWANFIKHPKSFILTHHPEFDFENSDKIYDKKFSQIINDEFVFNYYKGYSNNNIQREKNEELYNLLRNSQDVIVIFPDLEILTYNFCCSFNKFIDLVKNNRDYNDILNNLATIRSYFENEFTTIIE